MEKIDKLFGETFAQSLANETLNKNISNGLKKYISKIGLSMALGTLAVSSAGFAHADSTSNAIYATGAFVGLIADGMKPDLPVECQNVQGVSGGKLGAGTAIWGLLGEKQNKAKIAGSVITGGIMLGKEANRIQQDCNRILQNNRQYQNNNNQYQNNNNQYQNNGDYAYNNNNGGSDYSFQSGARPRQNNQNQNYQQNNNGYQQVNAPRYNQPVNMPTETILYQAVDNQGRQLYITASVSPGLRSLYGIEQGGNSMNSNPQAKQAIESSLNKLNADYAALDRLSKEYLRVNSGNNNTDLFITNYDQARNQTNKNRETSLARMKETMANFDTVYNQYCISRGLVVRNLDAATAAAHLDVSQYSNYQQLLNTPDSAKITYQNLNQGKELDNRYPTGLPAIPR